jgi:hypothetical protein
LYKFFKREVAINAIVIFIWYSYDCSVVASGLVAFISYLYKEKGFKDFVRDFRYVGE